MVQTIEEQNEIKRLKERIQFVKSECDKSIDSFDRLPVNLVLEARHNRLNIHIIELQSQIRERVLQGDSNDDILSLRLRLESMVGRAKEIGRMNGMLKSISQTSVKMEITRL